MAYVIAEPCVDVKDRACVDVCPVDCIYEYDPNQDGFTVPDVGAMGSGLDKAFVARKGATVLPRPEGLDRKAAAKQLFIHPEECIDCGACEPECPVQAIFAVEDLPAEWEGYIQINAAAFGC